MLIDGVPCRIGAFRTDEEMLRKLRERTGMTHSFLDSIDLPLALQARTAKTKKEKNHA
jgi:hypothetical protein